ncbi:MAG: SMP-30/gluconolactonase/LRE family protein [Ferruginibacter sp.]|nr:SMP-30/gluconolactonase/LRE family protein [Ferruginibacter sp.]
MKDCKAWMLRCVVLFFSVNAFAQGTQQSVTGQMMPILISDKFAFTEGPAANKAGEIFFTDQPDNKIWKFDTKGKLTVFLDSAGRSNGMYFDSKGNLITCADNKNELWKISPAGKVSVLVKNFKGHRLNGPNDCWLDRGDNIYFTDPFYKRDYWKHNKPDSSLKGQHLYFLKKGTNQPVIIDSNLKQPNGIVGSADGKYLYVSDIGASKIYRYNISKNGKTTNRMLFADDLSDGMTVDEKGNVYLAGNGVTVYNPKGEKIQEIEVPSKWTANLCFGGSDRKVLFITASESVYILPMKVRGAR